MADIPIPEDALEERFIAASGPGGQNVNKVATAVQLRLDVYALRLPLPVFQRLKAVAGTRMNGAGELVVTARRFRTQEANREDARKRIAELLEKAWERPERRIATKPSGAAKARRVDTKKGRSQIKAGRAKVRLD